MSKTLNRKPDSPIVARRKDGSPAQKGDRVLLVTDSGQKYFGDLFSVDKPMRFHHLQQANLQTYRVKCKDGYIRPCHARHIRFAAIPKFRRSA